MDLLEDIEKFHEKFGREYRDYPRHLCKKEKEFRVTCLKEECREYEQATTMEEELDAIVDLVYFALGTAYRHGFPFYQAWEKVHAANMKKIAAKRDEDSKRGNKLDIIKPEGWEPPDLSDLVYPQPNPALITHKGDGYAKKRKNLTEADLQEIVKNPRARLPRAESKRY